MEPMRSSFQSKRQRRWDAMVEDSCVLLACCYTRKQLPTRCEDLLSLAPSPCPLTHPRRKGPFDPDFLQLLAHVILGTILSKVRHLSKVLRYGSRTANHRVPRCRPQLRHVMTSALVPGSSGLARPCLTGQALRPPSFRHLELSISHHRPTQHLVRDKTPRLYSTTSLRNAQRPALAHWYAPWIVPMTGPVQHSLHSSHAPVPPYTACMRRPNPYHALPVLL